MHSGYPYIPCLRQTGAERFALGDQQLSVDLLSFWQWSVSDLVSNATRGRLAEYIVAMALGLTSGVRNEWDAYDLKIDGYKIEVKASGYLQSWSQQRLSRPIFSIRPARGWDPITGQMQDEIRRQSALYVFCLQHHQEKTTLNPLDLMQWSFYVLPTNRLDESQQFQKAKTISLTSFLSLKPVHAAFKDLNKSIVESIENLDGR